MAAVVRPLRALALHGWRTNAALMAVQAGRLQSVFGGEEGLSITYLNGPNVASKAADPSLEKLIDGPFYEWWDANETPSGEQLYDGMPEAVAHVQAHISECGPYDLLIGFSQGAMLATILTSLLEKPEHVGRPPFESMGGTVATEPWKLCVLVGGMEPRDHRLAELLSGEPLQTPSVHMRGEKDKLFELGARLMGRYSDEGGRRLGIIHAGGHAFPRGREGEYEKLRDFAIERGVLPPASNL